MAQLHLQCLSSVVTAVPKYHCSLTHCIVCVVVDLCDLAHRCCTNVVCCVRLPWLQGEVLGITRFGLAKMKESVLMLASVS